MCLPVVLGRTPHLPHILSAGQISHAPPRPTCDSLNPTAPPTPPVHMLEHVPGTNNTHPTRSPRCYPYATSNQTHPVHSLPRRTNKIARTQQEQQGTYLIHLVLTKDLHVGQHAPQREQRLGSVHRLRQRRGGRRSGRFQVMRISNWHACRPPPAAQQPCASRSCVGVTLLSSCEQ